MKAKKEAFEADDQLQRLKSDSFQNSISTNTGTKVQNIFHC